MRQNFAFLLLALCRVLCGNWCACMCTLGRQCLSDNRRGVCSVGLGRDVSHPRNLKFLGRSPTTTPTHCDHATFEDQGLSSGDEMNHKLPSLSCHWMVTCQGGQRFRPYQALPSWLAIRSMSVQHLSRLVIWPWTTALPQSQRLQFPGACVKPGLLRHQPPLPPPPPPPGGQNLSVGAHTDFMLCNTKQVFSVAALVHPTAPCHQNTHQGSTAWINTIDTLARCKRHFAIRILCVSPCGHMAQLDKRAVKGIRHSARTTRRQV